MADTLNISPDEKIAGVPLARLLRNLDETNYNEGSLDLACRLSDCKAVIEELLARRASPAAAVPEGALPPLPEPDGVLGHEGNGYGQDDWIEANCPAWSRYSVEKFARAAVEADRARQHQSGHMPPFAAPASFDKDAWAEVVSDVAELYARLLTEKQAVHALKGMDRGTKYYMADAIRWAVAELQRRCRAQGGDGAPEAGDVSADRAQQGEPAGWRDALEQARYALGKAPDLHALGFNECLSNSLPPGQPDETGCTAVEYEQAAEGIRVAIRKARNMVKDALYGLATKAAAPDAPNQCDGCREGAPVNKNGNHLNSSGFPYMACERSKYERAAPVPDTGIPAAGEVADLAKAIHWPECWDTTAYPTAASALVEVYAHFKCTQCGDVVTPDADCHESCGYIGAECDFPACKSARAPVSSTPASGAVEDQQDAARFRWIEENARVKGGGHGFTITAYVPFDEEDMGCGIDKAIAAAPSHPSEAKAGEPKP